MRENQLIVIADMEGASGNVDETREDRSAVWPEEIYPQGRAWWEYGRECITSDVLAVCRAVFEAPTVEIGFALLNLVRERIRREGRAWVWLAGVGLPAAA